MHGRHILIVLSVVAAMAALAIVVSAGDPDNPPGLPEATNTYTLEDIYHRLNAGTAGSQSAFTEPSAGPGTGTMRTINEIMEAAPALDNTNGVTPTQVLSGTTYWGLQDEAWGPQTGTMPNNGAGSTIVPATTNQSVAAGYWSSANTVQGDSDLAAGNIKSGVNLFGVDGAYPLTPVPKTGQVISYTVGDDGDLEMGVDWITATRFVTGTTGIVTDTLTGLVWLQDAKCFANEYSSFDNDNTAGDGMVTWQHALDFVAGMTETGSYSNCAAGFSDWRLPNVREMQSLIDYGISNPALPDGHPFTGDPLGNYWSSTTYEPTSSPYAWWVNLNVGLLSASLETSDLHVWPVRGGQ